MIKLEAKTIITEKFENSDCGIYMILNLNTNRIYIGKSNNLKRRMEEHVRNLYSGYTGYDNKNLQEDFEKSVYRIALLKKVSPEELDKYESIFYQAAKKHPNLNQLYNIQDLNKYAPTSEELDEAKEKIDEALAHKNNRKNTYIFYDSDNSDKVRMRLQDWLGKSEDEILEIAYKRIEELRQTNGVSVNQKEPILESISIKDLYENNELDYIMTGVMGDYFGDKTVQSFAEILGEKIGDIAYDGEKCLWAAAGPDFDTFRELKELNHQKKQKIYALFSLTLHKYEKTIDKDFSKYRWTDENGKVYFDTAPKRKTKSFKGLVITRFWTVEEDFPIDDFYDLYYRLERKILRTGQPILANDVSQCTRIMQPVVSKKEILSNKNLQKALSLDGELMYQFKKEKLSKTEEEYSSFLPCNAENHPVLYILAEVSDYVLMDAVTDN